MTTASDSEDGTEETEHLEDLDDGCGCAEVWEHLSEHRGGDADADTETETDADG